MAENDSYYFKKKYLCGYCKTSFITVVHRGSTNEHTVTNKVVCPVCKNYLKSWNEGEILKIAEKRKDL